MNKVVTNSFTLTALADGNNFHGVIKLIDNSNPLLQFINTSDGSISPNWDGSVGTVSKVPVFYLEIRDQYGDVVAYDNPLIYYNSDEPGTTMIEATGDTVTVNNVSMPTFKFVKNPASSQNRDDDFLYMKASINQTGTGNITISSDTRSVQIRSTSGGASYAMIIDGKNIEKTSTTGTLTAVIYNSNNVTQSPDNFSYLWYNTTGDNSDPIVTTPNKYTVTGNVLTVYKDAILGYDVFQCKAEKTADPNKGSVVWGTGGIADYSDPYECRLLIVNKNGTVGHTIKRNETYTVTPVVYQKTIVDDKETLTPLPDATVVLSFFNNNEELQEWNPEKEGNAYVLRYDTVVDTFGGRVRVDVSDITL